MLAFCIWTERCTFIKADDATSLLAVKVQPIVDPIPSEENFLCSFHGRHWLITLVRLATGM
jgi:hypothetical protein